MDKFDKATRSRVMSRSRSIGTRTTEWKFRSLLMRSGIKGWTLGHRSGLTGSPDVVFLRHRLAIFLDGCFWHGCRRCRSIPATNTRFWTNKIEKTGQGTKGLSERSGQGGGRSSGFGSTS